MDDIIIKTEHLAKMFRNGKLESHVLFDINLEIGRGEFVAVMGPSGCGKSTLMHIMGLMLSGTAGRLIIEGQDAAKLSNAQRAELRRNKIGFVFQRFNLLGTLNVYQNIAVAERIRQNSLDGQITQALQAVGLADKVKHKPSQLSIGQQQRVAIARAISHKPSIILADEPTGNLDSANSKRILEIFKEIHQKHRITIVMITHSQTAAQSAQRVINMTDGKIV